MKMNRMFCLAAAAALALTAAGCGSSGGKEPVIYTDPAVELAKVTDEVILPDTEGAEIELLSLNAPIDYCYSNEDADMIFEKKDGVWFDAMDHGVPLNQEKFEAMADNFLHLKAVSKVEDYGSLAACGLDDEAYSLYITDGEKGEIDILIGNQDAAGNYYMTLNESDVYTIKASTVDSMIFEYGELVIRDALDLTATADMIKNASVYTDGRTTTYKESDQAAMERIAAGISNLVPVEYASYYANEQELGASELAEDLRSVFSAEIEMDGETRSLTVYVGCYADASELYRYIQFDGSDMILIVDRTAVDDMMNGLTIEEE